MKLKNAWSSIDSEFRPNRAFARAEQDLAGALLRIGDVLHLLRDRADVLIAPQVELPGPEDSQAVSPLSSLSGFSPFLGRNP